MGTRTSVVLGIIVVAVLGVILHLVPKLHWGTSGMEALLPGGEAEPTREAGAPGRGFPSRALEPETSDGVTDPAVSAQLPVVIAQVALEPPGMPPDAMQIELNELRQQAIEMEARLPGGDFGPPANLAEELGQIGGDLERLERKVAQKTEGN